MSENKRKRSEDHYGSHYKPSNQLQSQTIVSDNSMLQQPIIINPVLAQGEQFGETEQVQLLNGNITSNQNTQSNLVYIILPPGVNQTQNLLQGVQTLLLVPKEEQASPGEGPPQLHYYMSQNEKSDDKTRSEDDEDVVFVKDVKVLKNENDQELTSQYLQNPQTDPLQIHTIQDGNNVSYTLVPPYEEVQQPPAGSVFVLNDSDLQKVQQADNTTDPLKYKMQFKCDYPGCILTFPSVYEKKIHADTHIFPANTEFKCTICNMVFDRAADRNKHVDSHAVVNTYKCKNCESAFPYYTTLVKHINEAKCCHKSYACHYCGVQFVDVDDLEKHQKENMKYCVCRAKICSEQAFELHTSLCTIYKQKMGRAKNLKRKKSHKSNDVIVLD